MTPEELIAFESDIAAIFNAGKIRAPVHLYSGNESQMIEIFREVKPEDWVFCSWRSHYQCLLKGVPPEEVKAEILAGRSISLCFPKYRVVSSAIVTGVLPIAVGAAMGIKRRGEKARVHCFVGEMTAGDRHISRMPQVFDEPPIADPVHHRGQRQIGLHRHARNVEPAGADVRKQPPSAGGLLQISNQISARRRRPARPILINST